MDFELSAERRMLVETIARYLGGLYAMGSRNEIAYGSEGWSRQHWRNFAELGVIGALFPEAAGGYGGTGHDIAAVFEAMGKALVVEPLFGALMAGTALVHAGDTAVLGQIISGATIVILAHDEPAQSDDRLRVERIGEYWRATGLQSVVPQAAAADDFLLVASTSSGSSLFRVRAKGQGVSVRDYPLVDGGRGGDLHLDDVPALLIGSEGGAEEAVRAAIAAGLLALCAEAIGIMDVLRDQTLDYLRTRHQFGVPIGSFQALKHRMATAALEIEQARSAVLNAAAAFNGDARSRDLTLAAAKYTIGRIGTLVAEEAIQMHGGIGMTWELPLSHYAKRLIMIGHQLGDEDHHLDRYIALRRTAA